MHGLVFPLITTSSGTKFGKSEGDNIWLDPARTSPYKFYQFWLNTDDRDVERYLKLFTFLEPRRDRAAGGGAAAGPRRPSGPRRLAWVATALVHGEAEADKARAASEALFGGGSGGLERHRRSSDRGQQRHPGH